jgi:hypothetical protein
MPCTRAPPMQRVLPESVWRGRAGGGVASPFFFLFIRKEGARYARYAQPLCGGGLAVPGGGGSGGTGMHGFAF